ncbi:MAG: hypothetical protein ACOCXJ_04405 [Planctomycetota bacterium]
MPAVLLCTKGSMTGREFGLADASAVRLSLQDAPAGQGALIIQEAGGTWTIANESQVPSQVNGVACQARELRHGDRIVYGPHEFEFLHGSQPGERQAVEHLQLGAAELTPMEAAEVASRYRSEDGESAVGGACSHAGPRRRRNSRRLSASRRAVIFKSSGNTGLFQRVADAFRRKDDRREELLALERERDELLRHAGRLALERGGGIGLPQGFLSAVRAGQTVTLTPEQMVQTDLERWAATHERLHELDAAIMSMRSELGLPVLDLHMARYHRSRAEACAEEAASSSGQHERAVPSREQHAALEPKTAPTSVEDAQVAASHVARSAAQRDPGTTAGDTRVIRLAPGDLQRSFGG